MNIPESAIKPFMPLGVPKLYVDSSASIERELDAAFNIMNHFENVRKRPVSLDAVDGYLRERIKQSGGNPNFTHVHKWQLENECRITIFYSVFGKNPFREYRNAVRSIKGFE